ncbi:C-type lectin domain family 19 member A-like [Saccoglossus kowalevskii]
MTSQMPTTDAEHMTHEPGTPSITVGCQTYYAFSAKVTWQTAMDHCISLNMELAIVNKGSLSRAIRDFLNNGNFDGHVKGYWIGLHDRNVEGNYEWLNGEDFVWTNWAKNQPSNATKKSPDGQDCVKMW